MSNVRRGEETGATSATPASGPRVVDVEALLVWAIRDQGADQAQGGASAMGYGYDSLIGLNRMMELGTLVDGGPAHHSFTFYAGARVLAGDAVRVHDTVRCLAGQQQLLVLRHARRGDRPDWLSDKPEFEPLMVWRKGRWVPKGIYDTSRNLVDVEMVDNRPEIAAARAAYGLWHQGLRMLAVALAVPGMLERHAVRGPAAPEAPWLENSDAA